ncbi:hypothetical protein SISSUDRAFT_1039334 [Sistotremastrum suecicum HHB10207 ss-3]|uniref:Non-structural maintenance of chromosomes element 1 homolog n=1 Tax=Sistotremastrum suecicum HHB10207 ss-3 TaxID=1314776 RepID=A0A166ITZ3_9AGAM|nr:hypothetical protein SISSUDRAFT_1039334 [Sistotremastrum suecicum HHB10207 ss-3]
MVSVNDIDRLFLQSILSRRIVSDKLFKLLWMKCKDAAKAVNPGLEVDVTETSDQLMGRMNKKLDPLNLEIKTIYDEHSGIKLYGLINGTGDPNAQLATSYTVSEIAFFKAIVQQIMLGNDECYSISSMAALRESNPIKPKMTKSQAEGVLNSFVTSGWLLKSSRGRYSLAPRTLMELGLYLKNTYDNDGYVECTVCMEILTRGTRCWNSPCQARLHHWCYDRFSKTRAEYECPRCRENWSLPANKERMIPIGEEAAKDGYDDLPRRRRADSEEEDEMEVDEDTEEERPQRKKSAPKKGRAAQAESEDEEPEPTQTQSSAQNDDEDEPSQPARRRIRRKV